jgi:HAE1 family hydrophobic/amphiphilic exporter-1
MTTFAIIAGLIPTALGLGIGGGGRAAIAVTVIGGQSLCLFLTLLLVPVAYVKFDALEQTALNRGWRDLLARVKTPRRISQSHRQAPDVALGVRANGDVHRVALLAVMADG